MADAAAAPGQIDLQHAPKLPAAGCRTSSEQGPPADDTACPLKTDTQLWCRLWKHLSVGLLPLAGVFAQLAGGSTYPRASQTLERHGCGLLVDLLHHFLNLSRIWQCFHKFSAPPWTELTSAHAQTLQNACDSCWSQLRNHATEPHGMLGISDPSQA